MTRKPNIDMAVLGVSKAAAAAVAPFAPPAPPSAAAGGGQPKSLTIKIDGPTYAALRAYCYRREQATGSRVTHQAVMVKALNELLERHSPA
jgi:hypothetical protein